MYDYVIVGAGSAGCVVANRLGEDPDVRVAVIEAGPPDDAPEIHMPLAFGQNLTSEGTGRCSPSPSRGSTTGATTFRAAASSAARARSTR